ncbi:MAG TPA: hypothetical protein VFS21_19880 [Roseiflexaceae bacterium]|nr:hypothetical protein [Roseiflexaceae bacterium]
MKKRIGFRLAGNILLAALVLLIAWNVLGLVQVSAAGIATAGAGLLAQLVALVVFALAVAAKTGHLRARLPRSLVDVGVWVLLVFLVLTLLSWLAAGTLLASPVSTLVVALMIPLTYRVAIGR